MTCKLSRKGPWYMIGMLFVTISLISAVLSSTSTVMIFLPILYEIFEALGYKKEEKSKFTTLLMMSLVVVCQIIQSTSPMGTYLFISAMLLLNSCFSNQKIGLPAWLAEVMGKVFNNVPAMVFFVLIFVVAVVLTQFISNAVTISLAMTIGMPLSLSLFSGVINPMVLCILLTMGINYAFATACATPPCAVAQDSGWLSSNKMLFYGLTAMVMCIIIALVVGIPLANAFCA